jgi:hypothetical protein
MTVRQGVSVSQAGFLRSIASRSVLVEAVNLVDIARLSLSRGALRTANQQMAGFEVRHGAPRLTF